MDEATRSELEDLRITVESQNRTIERQTAMLKNYYARNANLEDRVIRISQMVLDLLRDVNDFRSVENPRDPSGF